jgi:hypothetical protein
MTLRSKRYSPIRDSYENMPASPLASGPTFERKGRNRRDRCKSRLESLRQNVLTVTSVRVPEGGTQATVIEVRELRLADLCASLDPSWTSMCVDLDMPRPREWLYGLPLRERIVETGR